MNCKTTYLSKLIRTWSGKKAYLLVGLVALLSSMNMKSYAQVSVYSFSVSTGSYDPLTSGVVVGDAASDEQSFVDPAAPLGGTTLTGVGLPIGFNFVFNGVTFDRFGIHTNGWIFFGQSSLTPSVNAGSSTTTPLSNTTAPVPAILRNRIAPYGRDIAGQPGSSITYATIGTAPNRTLVVQWANYRRWASPAVTGESLNFQVRLQEGTNAVSFVYGTMTTTASVTPQVGLSGNTVADFFNRTSTTTWTATTPGTTNSATVTHTSTILPPSGLTFEFTPPSCFPVTGVTVSNISGTGATIRWTPSNQGATSFEYAVSTSSAVPTSGIAASQDSVVVTSLAPSTGYFVFVRSNCGAANGFSQWSPAVSFTTSGPVSTVGNGLWSSPSTWANGAVPSASTPVTINAGDSVILDVTTTIPSLQISGILAVDAAAARTLTVAGNLQVATSGRINFGTPTTGTALRIIEVAGTFNHAGNSNLANGNAALRFNGLTAQTINQTGTLFNNAVGQVIINNPAGVTLPVPLTVGFNVDLVEGVFNIGTNLTLDFAQTAGTSSQVRRSPYSSFNGTPNVVSSVYNVQYVFFTGQVSIRTTEGTEIPASRSISALTISNPGGLNLTGNLTLTAAASALVLTNGVIFLPPANKIICSNPGFAPPTGSATSFVNGGFEVVVSSATAVARNFPVGSLIGGSPFRSQVVISSMITGASTPQSVTVTPVNAPSGLGNPMGPRAFEITSTGSIGTTATVGLNWEAVDAATFIGTLANIRIVQASALGGPWTSRSTSATTGSLTGTGTRTTTAINLTNGNFFAWGTVTAADVAVADIVGPVSGNCFGTSETVVAVIRNLGGSIDRATSPVTIRGTVTTPGGTVINLTDVVRNSGIFTPGTNDTVSFTNAINMVDSGNYIVRVFIDSLTAQGRANDTLNRVVRSDAWTAIANPSPIVTSQSSTLQVLRNGLVLDTAQLVPSAAPLVRISEAIVFRTGTGAQLIYPGFIPPTAQDFLELTNFGGAAANIGGWAVEIFGAGARTYTFPTGTTIPAGGVLVLHIGPGADDAANLYYNTGGASDAILSTSLWGVTIRNGANLVDAVAFRGFTFPPAANVSSTDWSGNSPTTSSAGLKLINFDNNSASNWVVTTSTVFSSLGRLNPATTYLSRSFAWTGPGGFTANTPSVALGARNTATVENYTVTITATGSCTRTANATLQVVNPISPIAGFTISDTVATWGGIATTVNLIDTSLNIPFNWRWTITPANVVFVNGTTDSSRNASIQFTAGGVYSVALRVSNPAGVDSVVRANAITVSLAYCESRATNTSDTKIDSVILGTAATGSGLTVCETYSNFTDSLGVVATITKTQPFPMSVRSGYCGTSSFTSFGRVFIDFNRDGVFSENEAVGAFGPLAATGSGAPREWFNFNLIVPANADTGVTRLRVIFREGVSNSEGITGCGTYSWGETEDYLIRLVNPVVANPILLSPANNVFLNVNGPDLSVASIAWTPAVRFSGTVAPITYTWQLAARSAGNFNAPLLSIPANNSGADTALTLTFAQIDAALASLSVPVGDTVRGIWRVRAISGTDTVFSAQTWNIDIRRGTLVTTLTPFSLLSPPNNTVLAVQGAGSTPVNISWTRSVMFNNGPVTYQWLLDVAGGNFSSPLATISANMNGSDSVLTLSVAAIHNLLGSLGVAVGDSANLQWTVRATSGNFSRQATQVWNIRLIRGILAPLRAALAPGNPTGNTGTRGPTGAAGQQFLRVAMIVTKAEMVAASIDSGTSLANVAFRATIAASNPVRGRMIFYLRNAPDTVSVYSRGASWTDAIAGIPVVFDDSLTVPTALGLLPMQFPQPFVYTGGALEIAFDWASVAPFSAPATAGYAANTAITGSSAAAQGTTPPTTLIVTTNNQFRPELTWGADDRKENDLEVVRVLAMGRNPRVFGAPETVRATIRNVGYLPRTSIPVTMTVSGANTFTTNVTVPTLGPDSSANVVFAPWTATATGFSPIAVSVAADQNNNNNSRIYLQEVTDSIYAHSDSVTSGTGSVGFDAGAGLLLNKYRVTGSRSVRAARIRIGSGTTIVGNTVRAVVTNDTGGIVALSDPRVLAAADLNQWVVFTFPAPPNFTDTTFLVGLQQTANTPGYFPVAFQTENPARPNAFFAGAFAGGGLVQVAFRMMIEAHVGPTVVPVDTLSAFNLVAPTPNTTVNIQGAGTQTANISWQASTRSGGSTNPTSYEFLLDVPGTNFSSPVVRINAGTNTSLSLTFSQLADTLTAKGVAIGASFAGRWTVRATNDTLNRLANNPFNITLVRGTITSIEDTDFSKSIKLYPNPAAYTAQLTVPAAMERNLTVTIVNAMGQEVKEFVVHAGVTSVVELDLAQFEAGMYFVRISDGNELAIKRLMIQR